MYITEEPEGKKKVTSFECVDVKLRIPNRITNQSLTSESLLRSSKSSCCFDLGGRLGFLAGLDSLL
jgi:hypothetical protein